MQTIMSLIQQINKKKYLHSLKANGYQFTWCYTECYFRAGVNLLTVAKRS